LIGIPDFRHRHVPLQNLAACLFILAAVMCPYFLMGWFSSRQKRVLARSKTLEEIADQMGIEPAVATAWAEKNHLAPRFVIGEETLFDETEFDTANILLRASDRPSEPVRSLLRPAHSSSTTPDELVRPVVNKES
jgi:hypothetical protein